MAVITRQEEYRPGHWYTWVNTEGYNTVMLDTPYQMTEEQAVAFQADYLDRHLYDNTPQASVSIYDNLEVIRAAVTYIKTANPNLTQWNAYLAVLPWDDALAVRWFLAVLARELAQRAEISLGEFTETEVLSKLKTWIINTPARRLEKILFNIQ